MSVAIVTDSAASLPVELVDAHGIAVVPMQLTVAGRTLPDEPASLGEVVAHLDGQVVTSAPSPGAFRTVLEQVTGTDGTVVVTVGRRYSATSTAAALAADMGALGGPVAVVDSGTAAGAEGLVVLAAARAAADGHDLAAVVDTAERVAGQVHLVAAVEELRHLVRGGRLPVGVARAGTRLGIHVLFELRASGPRPMRPTVSTEGALEHLVARFVRTRRPGARAHVAALHALRPGDADRILELVAKETEPATAFVGTFGPVMVAHTGPGVVGLAWWWE